MLDRVIALQRTLDDVLTNMGDIINDSSISKGSKVNKLIGIKSSLNKINNSMDDLIKNEKLTASIDGTVGVNLLTSRNDFRVQMRGLESLFVIDIVSEVDPHNPEGTLTMYHLNVVSHTDVPYRTTCLVDALTQALKALISNGSLTKEYLNENYGTSLLIHRILNELNLNN